jgi:hypothetical protein
MCSSHIGDSRPCGSAGLSGPVDVAGGWFDAGGGYEKFAYTVSYADALMLIAARALSNQQGPGSYPALLREAEFGLQWITKLWNPVLKVLYAQVGIGNGNASNTIQGDYNFWFLPQQEEYGGSDQFASFAQQQLNFALGANAWGSSFVVGAGTVFPHCMQSEIANLAGSLAGSGDIQVGATTDGPSSIGNFSGLGTVPGMRACSAGNFAPFNTATAGYEDNVVSWPSVEPADDYAAASLFAFALGGAGLG